MKYFEARMFYNDLDNHDDYYLQVNSVGENKFIRKDSIKNGNIY